MKKKLKLHVILLSLLASCTSVKEALKPTPKKPLEISVGNCTTGFGVQIEGGESKWQEHLLEQNYVCMKAEDFEEFIKRLQKK